MFGKKYRQAPPKDSLVTFNAAILNGLSRAVQKSVERSKKFDTFMDQIISKIEKDDINTLSICCTSGRHRSVTCA